MKRMPLVSVIMPAFNCAKYIGEAIESILSQTFTDFEFIIIDDGSKDETHNLLLGYVEKDTRIRLIRNEKNLGIATSFNKGLRIAKGKYIARMDADDISMPSRFEQQIAFLFKHPSVGVLGTTAKVINEHGETMDRYFVPADHSMIAWALPFGHDFANPTVMIRAKVIKKAGGYFAETSIAEDVELWIKLAETTRFANIQKDLLIYRTHPQATSRIKNKMQREDALIAREKFISRMIGTPIPHEMMIWLRESQTKYHSLTSSQIQSTIGVLTQLYEKMVEKSIILPEDETLVHADLLEKIENIYKNRVTLSKRIYFLILGAKRKVIRILKTLLKEEGKT